MKARHFLCIAVACSIVGLAGCDDDSASSGSSCRDADRPAGQCECQNGSWKCDAAPTCTTAKPADNCECRNGSWNCGSVSACTPSQCGDVAPGYTCDTEKKECNCGGTKCDLDNEVCDSGKCQVNPAKLLVALQSDVPSIAEDGSNEIVYRVSLDRAPKGTVAVKVANTMPNEVSCVAADDSDTASLDAQNWNTGVEFRCKGTAPDYLTDAIECDYVDIVFTTSAAETDSAFDNLSNNQADVKLTHPYTPDIIITPTLSPEKNYTTEDGGFVTMHVSLGSWVQKLDVHISIENEDGTETPYASTDRDTLHFSPTSWKSGMDVVISGEDDGDNPNTSLHAYRIKIAADPNTDDANALPYLAMEPKTIVLYNLDNDASNVLTDVDSFTVTESGGTADVGVKLPIPPTTGATVQATVEPGTECAIYDGSNPENILRSASLSFDGSNYDTFQSVHIVGRPDGNVDGDQACTLHLTASSSDKDTPYNGKPFDVAGTNLDNGNGGIGMSLKNSNIYEYYFLPNHPQYRTQTTLGVSLRTQPSADVTLTLSANNQDENDTDVHASLGKTSLTFTPENYSTVQNVTVKGVRDYKVTPTRTVILSAKATSTDTGYRNVENQIPLRVKNFDSTGITITYPEVMTLSEAEPGVSQPVKVSLKSKPTADVTLNAVSGNQLRLAVGTSQDPKQMSNMQTVIIHPDDWEREQTFYVFPFDDNIQNTDNFVPLKFSTSSADADYNNLSIVSQSFTIKDDEYVRTINISCNEIECPQYGGEKIVSCGFSLVEKPTDLESATMNCTVKDATGIGISLPKESSFSLKFSKAGNWTTSHSFPSPMASPCCGNGSTQPHAMNVRMYQCQVDEENYKAKGTGYINMEYRPGICSWAQ